MTSEPDQNPEVLISQARTAGDATRRDAVDGLLASYRNYLSVLARVCIDRRLQAKADDSDLVQETLMQAHRDFAAFRGTTETELVAWLRTILASKGAMLVRQFYATQQRNPRMEVQIEQDLEMARLAVQ